MDWTGLGFVGISRGVAYLRLTSIQVSSRTSHLIHPTIRAGSRPRSRPKIPQSILIAAATAAC